MVKVSVPMRKKCNYLDSCKMINHKKYDFEAINEQVKTHNFVKIKEIKQPFKA